MASLPTSKITEHLLKLEDQLANLEEALMQQLHAHSLVAVGGSSPSFSASDQLIEQIEAMRTQVRKATESVGGNRPTRSIENSCSTKRLDEEGPWVSGAAEPRPTHFLEYLTEQATKIAEGVPFVFVVDGFGEIYHACPFTQDALWMRSDCSGRDLFEFLPEEERHSFAGWLGEFKPSSLPFVHHLLLPSQEKVGFVSFRQTFADSRSCFLDLYAGARRMKNAGELFLVVSYPQTIDPVVQKVSGATTDDVQSLAHEDRLASMGQMTANLVHEVKQPLSAISNYAASGLRFLRLPEPNLGEVEDALIKLQDQGEYANSIIRAMREFSSKQDFHVTPGNLNDVLLRGLALCEPLFRDEQVSVILQLEDDLPTISLDSTTMTQVAVNLLRNAVEAMRDMPTAEKIIRVQSTSTSSDVQFSISDSGSGISPALAKNLFQPFQTNKKGGMGIGLTLCRSIVQLHHGNIWATPNLDIGTTFFVRLPSLTPRRQNGT